jgi:diphthine methyl ester acylhydrolase
MATDEPICHQDEATTHQQITLDFNADVAEWCTQPSSTDLLAAATYQLDEATGQRQGRVYIYRLQGSFDARDCAPDFRLRQLTTTDMPGVFDLTWLQEASPDQTAAPLLAAALADGSVRLFRCAHQDGTLHQRCATQSTSDGGTDMVLSVDSIVSAAPPSDSRTLASSHSSGDAQLLRCTASDLIVVQRWKAHELEAWHVCFDCHDENRIYTGGDDSAFKAWDTRQHPDRQGPCLLWSDRKQHKAGVCCVASHPTRSNLVCTGSYDEQARVWDVRQPARPVVHSAVTVAGGGVWRLKWHPRDTDLLLAACMHAGFAVLRLNGDMGGIELVEQYAHQQTLAYGAGWCERVGADGTSLVATCSFYDRLLHLWSPRTKACVSDK